MAIVCGPSGVGKSSVAVPLGAPVVLEGCYLVPELASEFGDAVRAVVLHEPAHGQLAANLQAREPDPDGHGFRAEVSVEIGVRLAARARAADIAVVRPTPWADALANVTAALAHGWTTPVSRMGPEAR